VEVRKPFCVFLLYGSGGGGHLASAQALFDLIKVRVVEYVFRIAPKIVL